MIETVFFLFQIIAKLKKGNEVDENTQVSRKNKRTFPEDPFWADMVKEYLIKYFKTTYTVMPESRATFYHIWRNILD